MQPEILILQCRKCGKEIETTAHYIFNVLCDDCIDKIYKNMKRMEKCCEN